MPPTAAQIDPYLVHRFAVEVDGVMLAGFGEVSGLEAKTEVMEYSEGGLNTHTHKLPGRTSYGNITLKRGASMQDYFWDWYSGLVQASETKSRKRSVSIVHYNEKHEEVRRWNLTGAFPVKWSGPAFNTAQSQVAIESLELAYAEFEIVSSS